MTRKVWDDGEGRLVKKPGDGVDPFAPVEATERDLPPIKSIADLEVNPLIPGPLGIECVICNAKPGEKCGSLLQPFRYLDETHYTRRKP